MHHAKKTCKMHHSFIEVLRQQWSIEMTCRNDHVDMPEIIQPWCHVVYTVQLPICYIHVRKRWAGHRRQALLGRKPEWTATAWRLLWRVPRVFLEQDPWHNRIERRRLWYRHSVTVVCCRFLRIPLRKLDRFTSNQQQNHLWLILQISSDTFHQTKCIIFATFLF